MFSKVSMDNLHLEKIGTNGLRSLKKTLTDSKRVSSLTLTNPNLHLNAKRLTILLDSTNHWRNISFIYKNHGFFNRKLQKSFTRLEKWKDLSTFPLGWLSIGDPRMTNRINQCLRLLRRLETLALDLYLYSSSPTFFNYKPPRSLQNLYINFRNKTASSQQGLFELISRLQKANQLDYLSLNFAHSYKIEVSDVQLWTSFFQNTPHLIKGIRLSLYFNHVQQTEHAPSLFESFKHPNYLTKLDLQFWAFPNAPTESYDDFFVSLSTSLQALTQLEDLHLLFALLPVRLKQDTFEHFASMLKYLKNLKSLRMFFPPQENPDEGLLSIAHNLQQLSNLEVLHLYFYDASLRHQSVEFLSKSIAHLHLVDLHLDFGCLQIGHPEVIPVAIPKFNWDLGKLFCCRRNSNRSSLTPFFFDIGSLTLLTSLNLHLPNFEISSYEWRFLSDVLKQLKDLSSLTLTLPIFSSNNNFEGLQTVLSCLKDLSDLTHLELGFGTIRIWDRQVKVLSENLTHYRALTSLKLHFSEAETLRDSSLGFLLLGIRSLLTLENLTIEFLDRTSFGEEAISEFLKGLTDLKQLRSFDFGNHFISIYGSQNTSLPPNLKNYENLKHVTSFCVNESRYI